MATQGVPTLNHFDASTGRLDARFTLDTMVDAPTVIYLNEEYWYPNGYTYQIMVEGAEAPIRAYFVDATDKQRLAIKFNDHSLAGKLIELSFFKNEDILSLI